MIEPNDRPVWTDDEENQWIAAEDGPAALPDDEDPDPYSESRA